MKKKQINIAILLITMMMMALTSKAQMSPIKAQYFQNPYLVNPAMAGVNGNTIFASYANQWNKIEGSPVLLALSASGMVTDKAALGFNLLTDKSGLLRRTQALGTFAYKVAIDQENSIRFGVSFSWSQNKLDQTSATGNGTNDPALGRYNEQQSYLDGNFGMAYIGKKVTAQFSYLSLNQKRQNQLSTVDYATFYSAVSYLFDLDQASGITVKPLIAYRGVKGYDNQYDVAAEWGVEKVRILTMYHSNKSFSGGVGFKNLNKLSLSGIYSTDPKGIQGLTGGQFDVTLGYHF